MAEVNYTVEQTKRIVEAYKAEPTRTTVDLLAKELGKTVRTIPQIVIDEKHIGGFNELREYFIDKGKINFRGELLDINDFEL